MNRAAVPPAAAVFPNARDTRARRVLIVVAALGAANAPLASAADVNVATAPALTSALAAAAASPESDRIFLAAGTYAAGGNGFLYNGLSPIEVIGAGTAQTKLTAGGSFTLLFSNANAKARVAAMEVVAATSLGGQQIGIKMAQGSINDVLVTGDAVASPNATGILLTGDATVTSVTTTNLSSRGIEVSGGNVTITGVTISGVNLPGAQGIGIAVDAPSATANISRARISHSQYGVQAAFGGTATITDSLIDVPTNASGLIADDNGNNVAFASTVIAERDTIVAAVGTSGTRGALAVADAGDTMVISIRDSVLSNLSQPLYCGGFAGGKAAITTASSNLPLLGVQDDCGGNITHMARTQFTPGFVDAAAGDYRLRFDSPLVDLGSVTPPPPLGTLDLAGTLRPIDGNGDGVARVDVGAFEYPRSPPVVSALVSSTNPVLGQQVAFVSTATDPDPGEGALTSVWTFDDGASASGASAAHTWLTTGSHTATVTVTDPAGASAKVTITVSVTGAGTPVTLTDPPSVEVPSPGGSPPSSDARPVVCVVPTLRGARIAVARRRLRAAHCSLGAIRRHPGSPPVVTKQTPRPGARLRDGAKVAVGLGRLTVVRKR